MFEQRSNSQYSKFNSSGYNTTPQSRDFSRVQSDLFQTRKPGRADTIEPGDEENINHLNRRTSTMSTAQGIPEEDSDEREDSDEEQPKHSEVEIYDQRQSTVQAPTQKDMTPVYPVRLTDTVTTIPEIVPPTRPTTKDVRVRRNYPPVTGNRYGEIFVSGNPKILQGNVYSGTTEPTHMRTHQFGNTTIQDASTARIMQGNVPLAAMKGFWD